MQHEGPALEHVLQRIAATPPDFMAEPRISGRQMDARVTAEEAERYPDLSEAGRALLERLREHPHAPVYRNHSGHHLRPQEVAQVRALEQEVLAASLEWQPQQPPAWLAAFTAECLAKVPTLTRADLAREVAYLVPDDVAIDRLINYRTSGTSGHPLLIASHPRVAAQYLAYHKRALRRFGIELRHGRGQVGVILVGFQASCFTYVSVTPTMDESGLAKLNLHPNDWRDPADRKQYLEALQPEVITGDPLSFTALLEIAPVLRPAALISTSMTLLPGLRQRLEQYFGCPVLDVYSMNEAGPLAVFDPAVGGHVLLQPRLYVEILDGDEQPAAPGERGEVTLTGGFNFCLPLLRYRTGDYARLLRRGEDLVLLQLEGRPPVRYCTTGGEWLNNVEITHALRPLPLAQFCVHQNAQGDIAVQYVAGGVDPARFARHWPWSSARMPGSASSGAPASAARWSSTPRISRVRWLNLRSDPCSNREHPRTRRESPGSCRRAAARAS